MTPEQEALNNLFGVVRQVQLSAEQHEQLAKCYQIVAEAIKPIVETKE